MGKHVNGKHPATSIAPFLVHQPSGQPAGHRSPPTPSRQTTRRPLTSSVWDVCAVEGCAFLPVENEWIPQQVHRGESVPTQSWQDEVQKTAHPALRNASRESWLSLRGPNAKKAVTKYNLRPIIKLSQQSPFVNGFENWTGNNLLSVFHSR